MKNRWYDNEPILSLAISLLRSDKSGGAKVCVDYILDVAKENNLQLNLGFIETLKLKLQRKGDADSFMLEALEYLKIASPSLQKEIAIKIIQMLQDSEKRK